MEALCLVGEKEGNFWLNGARVAEGARRGVAECDLLGAERWRRSNPQKLSGWRGGERESWRRLCGGAAGREGVAGIGVAGGDGGVEVPERDVGEGVAVGNGTGEG